MIFVWLCSAITCDFQVLVNDTNHSTCSRRLTWTDSGPYMCALWSGSSMYSITKLAGVVPCVNQVIMVSILSSTPILALNDLENVHLMPLYSYSHPGHQHPECFPDISFAVWNRSNFNYLFEYTHTARP